MKKYLILILLLVFGILAFLLWPRPTQEMGSPKSDQESIRHQNISDEPVKQRPEENRKTNKEVRVVGPPPAAKSDPVKQEQIFRDYVEEQNVPINFYGKIIDQDNNPVPGAKVKVKIRQWFVESSSALNSEANMITIEKVTLADGSFEIQGVRGDGFDIEYIQKEGYQLSPKTYLHVGASERRLDANPMIFRMWKIQNAENLITYDKDTRIPYDGTPVVFDLLKGAKSTAADAIGDLRVTLHRNPLEHPLGSKEKYDWVAVIEALDGGIAQSKDEFMYQAPEVGYEPRLEIEMSKTNLNWSPVQQLSFYLRSRGGQCYGRVTVKFVTDSYRETTGFTITSAVNPSGSRNLQP